MALDVQRNWDLSMAHNLAQTLRGSSLDEESVERTDQREPLEKDSPKPQAGGPAGASSPRARVYLPDEIVLQILSFIPRSSPDTQSTYATVALLSRQWHLCASPFLYAAPRLYGSNYERFVSTICPSINVHIRKSRLAGLVKVLDLGALVHQGSKSVTARLLGRVKGSLEAFRAPQASFALNCFPALAKCRELKQLDLSLVSECPPLPELFRTLAGLHNLEALRLPRSSGFGPGASGVPASPFHRRDSAWHWPSRLNALSLSGGLDMRLVHGSIGLPATLTSLTIEHCPSAKRSTIESLIRVAVQPLPKLKRLKVMQMPRLSAVALDTILLDLPQLEELSVGVEYVSAAMFDVALESPLRQTRPEDVPHVLLYDGSDRGGAGERLHTLELTNATRTNAADLLDKLGPIDIISAMDEGALPALRRIRVSKSLSWSEHADSREEAEHLASMLAERAEKTGEDAGLWFIEG